MDQKSCVQDQLDKEEQGLEDWMEKLRCAPKEIVHRALKDLYRNHYGVDGGEYYWYLEQIEDEDEVTENELAQIRKELLWAKDDDQRERRRNRAAGEEEEKLLKNRTMYEALALYFERRKRKQRICSIVLIILTLVFIVPFALASIYVIYPFVTALGFRDNRCHVVNVTDVSDLKRDDCFEVFVQYTDLDSGTNVTTLLHLDEINLDNKVRLDQYIERTKYYLDHFIGISGVFSGRGMGHDPIWPEKYSISAIGIDNMVWSPV